MTATVSVKLADQTKARIDRLAKSRGTTPHALMVRAVEAAVDAQEDYDDFMASALRARDEMIASGKAYDGREVVAYAKAKLRGEKAVRPRLKSLNTLLKSA